MEMECCSSVSGGVNQVLIKCWISIKGIDWHPAKHAFSTHDPMGGKSTAWSCASHKGQWIMYKRYLLLIVDQNPWSTFDQYSIDNPWTSQLTVGRESTNSVFDQFTWVGQHYRVLSDCLSSVYIVLTQYQCWSSIDHDVDQEHRPILEHKCL